MRLLIPVTILLAAVLTTCSQPARSSAPGADTPTPATYFGGAISLTLEAPSQVRQREELTGLDVVMTNEGEEPFTFRYSGNLLDFEVVDDEGDVIWNYLGAAVLPLGSFTLKPGQSKTLSEMEWSMQGEWDLRDRQGFPVAPGEYGIRGVVRIGLPDQRYDSVEPLKTALYTLTVEEAPLPDYAQAIDLELIAPEEVQAREPVPLDLRITNTGDKPVTFWWSGGSTFPLPNYMDIFVFRDGERYWSVASAAGLRYTGTLKLEPGESRTMSSFDFVNSRSRYEGTGEPWLWDQRPDCGPYRFTPCPRPVELGTYTVRAVVNVSESETSERTAITTEPHELVITPCSDGTAFCLTPSNQD